MKKLLVLICSVGLLVIARANSQFPLTEEVKIDTVMPSFQGGGIEEFRQWIEENRQYPKNSLYNRIEGKVEVQFTVDTGGKVVDVKVVKGINRELGGEAQRVVSASPKWVPGTANGKPVQVTCNVSIVFDINSVPPTFRSGGVEGFREWVVKNVEYPEFIWKNGMEGKVVVRFTINTQGKVVDAKVIESSYFELNDAVLHAIRKSPKWKPGTENGKPVNVTITLPIIFRLE